jgi:carbon-monoxide dehydrogenase iron sulfur subunit
LAKEERRMGKIIAINIEKCMGCKSCEIGCAVAHSSAKDLITSARLGEKPGYRISVEAYRHKPVPVNCQHCEEPACMLACPTGAIHREEEGKPLLFDGERCIGCRMCVQACPFGVITLSRDGKRVLKCDLCIERLAAGQEPACVTACPTGALLFIDEEEANRAKRRKVAERMVTAGQAAQKEHEQNS